VRDSIEPSDVFRLVPDTDDAFAARRVEAERIARHLRRDAGEAPEVTLDQIYDVVARLERRSVDPRHELDAERRMLRPRAAGVALHQHARAAGKRLFAVSDTYFEARQLEALLTSHGLAFEDVLVSSTSGGGKYDGVLYRALLERTGVVAERIVHVGDNEVADVAAAARAGIPSLHLPKNHELLRTDAAFDPEAIARLKGLGTFAANHLLARAARRREEGWRSLGQLRGELELGPCTLAAARWCVEEADRQALGGLDLVADDGSLLALAVRLLDAERPVRARPVSAHPASNNSDSQAMARRRLAGCGLSPEHLSAIVEAGPDDAPRGGGSAVSKEAFDGAAEYLRETTPLAGSFTAQTLRLITTLLADRPLVRRGLVPSAPRQGSVVRRFLDTLRRARRAVARGTLALSSSWRVGGPGLLWRMGWRVVCRRAVARDPQIVQRKV
jgi:FMN phosphatase YigB (HAD superfamily)